MDVPSKTTIDDAIMVGFLRCQRADAHVSAWYQSPNTSSRDCSISTTGGIEGRADGTRGQRGFWLLCCDDPCEESARRPGDLMSGTGNRDRARRATEGFWRWGPIVRLASSLPVFAWHAVAPRPATARAVQMLMLLFIVAGGIGLGQHYLGNMAFELEMRPALEGRELFVRTVMGATPTLAPGTLSLLGFIGLASTYRDPALESRVDTFLATANEESLT